jgi:1-acyl-sn-glycerol-3-phosphate acyltransferase
VIALRWIISLVFIVQIYLTMALLALVFTIPALFNRDMALRAIQTWCRWVRWSANAMLGLRTEVRGPVPTDEVIIAAKHQSFLDIIMIASVVPQPKFIMKAELRWAPILGWYAMRIGCVPVNRGKRGAAIQKMKADVAAGAARPGQLVIYPQGTRVAPGARVPYRVGTGVLYEQLGQPCVPAATNVGHFWPKRGILRRPGLAVVEFLPVIPPGLTVADFMQAIETAVETASDRLSADVR